MVQKFSSVSPNKFHRIFSHLSPCDCHEEDFDTSYNVRVVGDNNSKFVKLVIVSCSSCGACESFDVSSYKVREDEVNFSGKKTTK